MPSIAITQPYEAVYIVDPGLGDEQIGTIKAKYQGIVETGGGTVENIDVWERRRLAYEIKGRNEGIYIVMQFQSKPDVEAELRRIFQISEDQIRFLIVRRDEDDATPPVVNGGMPTRTQVAAPAAQPSSVETPAPVVEAAPAAEAAPEAEAAPATEAAPEAEAPTADAAPAETPAKNAPEAETSAPAEAAA